MRRRFPSEPPRPNALAARLYVLSSPLRVDCFSGSISLHCLENEASWTGLSPLLGPELALCSGGCVPSWFFLEVGTKKESVRHLDGEALL